MVYGHKKQGGVTKLLPIIIGMTGAIIISLMLIYFVKEIALSEDIDQISRHYILRMESDGYLKGEVVDQLVESLSALGAKEINLSGTTFEDVGYGNNITLSIKLKIPVTELVLGDSFDLGINNFYRDIYIKKVTTSKN